MPEVLTPNRRTGSTRGRGRAYESAGQRACAAACNIQNAFESATADNERRDEICEGLAYYTGVAAWANSPADARRAAAAALAGGDLHHAIKTNVMTEQDVHGELSAIVSRARTCEKQSRSGVRVRFDRDGSPGCCRSCPGLSSRCCRRCRPARGAERQTSQGGHDPSSMKDLVWYFFKLGSFGFGGPAALVG